MIKLDKKYFIDSDERQYILCERSVTKTGKTAGNEIIKAIGYYSTIQGALDGYYKMKTRLFVANNDCTIQDAIKEFNKIKEEIKNLIEI